MENPTKMDDLGVPLFSETSIPVSFNRNSTFKKDSVRLAAVQLLTPLPRSKTSIHVLWVMSIGTFWRHPQPTNQPTNQTKQTKPNQTKPNQTSQKNSKRCYYHDSYQLWLEKVGKPNKNTSIPPKKIHLSWHYNSMPHWQMLHGIHRRMRGTSRKPKITRRVLNSLNWQHVKSTQIQIHQI